MSRLNIQTGEKRFPVAPDLYGSRIRRSPSSAERVMKISAGRETAASIPRCFATDPLRIRCCRKAA